MDNPISDFFTPAEWRELPLAVQSGFIDLDLDSKYTSRKHMLGRVLIWLLPVWEGSQPRLHVGPRGHPKISWVDNNGACAELEVRDDRIVWYVEGMGEGSDLIAQL
jgi:hypothetical protein